MNKEDLPPEVIEYFRAAGKRGGLLGGKAAAEAMTAEQRSERARKAAKRSGEVRSEKARLRKLAEAQSNPES